MYYICDEEDDEYFIPMYPRFYEVIDPRFSKYWGLGIYINDEGSHYPEIVFKEWSEEEIFYERLVEGKEREEAIFKKYKQLMNEEFN